MAFVLLLLAFTVPATAFTVPAAPFSRWTSTVVGGRRSAAAASRLHASEYFTEDTDSFPSDSGDPPIDDTGTYEVDPLLKVLKHNHFRMNRRL